jgi:hypothetical protein
MFAAVFRKSRPGDLGGAIIISPLTAIFSPPQRVEARSDV